MIKKFNELNSEETTKGNAKVVVINLRLAISIFQIPMPHPDPHQYTS
jgi:hypothetical protein